MRHPALAVEYQHKLPAAPTPAPTTAGFVIIPMNIMQGMSLQQWLYQQALYQAALAEAQAVARPSLPERDLLGVWN